MAKKHLAVVSGRALIKAMTEAGIFDPEDHVRRIVIDIDTAQIPVIYTERFGDRRLLDVVTTLEGVKVVEHEPVTETRGGEDFADTVAAPVPEELKDLKLPPRETVQPESARHPGAAVSDAFPDRGAAQNAD